MKIGNFVKLVILHRKLLKIENDQKWNFNILLILFLFCYPNFIESFFSAYSESSYGHKRKCAFSTFFFCRESLSTVLAIASLRKCREKWFNIIRIGEEQENPGDVEISFLVLPILSNLPCNMTNFTKLPIFNCKLLHVVILFWFFL